MTTVAFSNHRGVKVTANLHFPPDFRKRGIYAAIVVAHPMWSCSEQLAQALYGSDLGGNWAVVLTFPACHPGTCDGPPCVAEDPNLRVEDLSCAVDYLVTLKYVNEVRIGLLGICGAGGYAIKAAMIDRRFRAVATVAPVNVGRMLREGSADPVAILQVIAHQRTSEARGAARQEVEHIPTSVEEAKKPPFKDPYLVEATGHYTTKQRASASLLLSRQAAAFAFDAFGGAEHLLTQPLQIIAGDVPGVSGAHRDEYEIFGRAKSEDKDICVITGASNHDLCWEPNSIRIALDRLTPFQNKHLAVTWPASRLIES